MLNFHCVLNLNLCLLCGEPFMLLRVMILEKNPLILLLVTNGTGF